MPAGAGLPPRDGRLALAPSGLSAYHRSRLPPAAACRRCAGAGC